MRSFCFVIFLSHRSLRYLAYDAIEADALRFISFFASRTWWWKICFRIECFCLSTSRCWLKRDRSMQLCAALDIVASRGKISVCESGREFQDARNERTRTIEASETQQTPDEYANEYETNKLIRCVLIFQWIIELTSNNWRSGTGCCVIFTTVNSFLCLCSRLKFRFAAIVDKMIRNSKQITFFGEVIRTSLVRTFYAYGNHSRYMIVHRVFSI